MRSLRILICGIIFLSFSICSMAVRAEEAIKPDDTITLHLNVEDWVETQTAAVQVAIVTAGNGVSAGVREEVLKILATLTPGDWKILQFIPTKDRAGLDRQEILAEVRASDKQLAGIYDRAKKASIPGKQVRVASIYFSPTVAEQEALLIKLRGQIYKKITEEIALLKATFPDRSFRVGDVTFDDPEQVSEQPRESTQAEEDATVTRSVESGPTMTVSERRRLSATVVLSAIAPK